MQSFAKVMAVTRSVFAGAPCKLQAKSGKVVLSAAMSSFIGEDHYNVYNKRIQDAESTFSKPGHHTHCVRLLADVNIQGDALMSMVQDAAPK